MSQPDLSPALVESRDERYVLPTYARASFHPRSGRGARLVDADGAKYWDLLGGIAVNALGHSNRRIVKALRQEAGNVLHVSNLYYHPWQGLLAERLVKASGLSRAFFCNSGTEANEAALKFARLVNPGRSGIVALEESFHGRTFGSLSVTGHEAYRAPFEPLVPGVSFIPPNDLDALRSAVGPETSAVILEPVMGEGGVIPLTTDFLQAARRLTEEVGATLILDEIQCGLGRTGTLFAFEQAGVLPDIVTLAKPLGGGLPLGAVLTGALLDGLVKPGHHGTTFGGNPIACRLGLAVLDEIEENHLLRDVRKLGIWLGAKLRRLQKKYPQIVDVRGTGLIWGIELASEAKPVARALFDRGFIVGTARENVIRLLPPYVTPKKALASFVGALESILEEMK